MKPIVLCGALGLALAGCAAPGSLSRAMSYESKTNHVETEHGTFRVFNHKTEDAVMTTPSMGAAMGSGMAASATFGLADVSTPEAAHRNAARKFLDETGRQHCEITYGRLVINPQYEFFYACS